MIGCAHEYRKAWRRVRALDQDAGVRAVVLERGLIKAEDVDKLLSAEAATALGHR